VFFAVTEDAKEFTISKRRKGKYGTSAPSSGVRQTSLEIGSLGWGNG